MDFNKFERDLDKALHYLEEQFTWLQVWRANPRVLENLDVFVPSYGSNMKISSLATVGTMDAQTLKIEAWDKAVLSSIEKGIIDSNIWLTPTNQWTYLMIKFPIPTTERRQELQKMASKYGEEAKISIRNARHDSLASIKRQLDAKEISENDKWSWEKRIDDIVKDYNKRIDTEVKNKQDDIMKV